MDEVMNYKAIWRLPEVMTRTGLSRSTIYELIRHNQFPSQINLGPRAVGWVASEITEWIDARIAKSRACKRRTAKKNIRLVN
jgi:prophage regulatory protein